VALVLDRSPPFRSRVALLVTGLLVASGGLQLPPASAGAIPTSRYVAISPARLLDTRSGIGAATGKVGAGATLALAVAGVGGVPVGATAVVLNVTATGTNAGGYISVFPAGVATPTVSNLNADQAGQTLANLVTVPVGVGGKVNVFSSVGTHLIADVFGYYEVAAASKAGRFVPLAPTRAYDSRGRSRLASNGTLRVPLATWVPGDAVAVVLNVTVDQPSDRGFITVWAGGTPQPGTSNLNIDYPDQTVANQVIVPVTASGIDVYSSAATDVIVDLAGYFSGTSAASASTGLFVPISPERLLDTRSGGVLNPLGNGVRPLPGWTVEMPVIGRAAIPAGASAIAMNTTLVDAGRPGYVTVYPAGVPLPNSSNVNAMRRGHTIANHVVVPVTSRGASLFSFGGGHMLADVSGYFTGDPMRVEVAPAANPAPRPTFPMKLTVPSIGVTTNVVEGIGLNGLEQNAGHWPGTALPGANGNVAIFGHRTSHTRPFRDLDRLRAGDDIVVESNGLFYRYTVTQTVIASPSDADTIGKWTSTPTISLVACHPPGSVDFRIVVRAELAEIY
jgi:LPXTG-site transpeptidase (sortase) family protein